MPLNLNESAHTDVTASKLKTMGGGKKKKTDKREGEERGKCGLKEEGGSE
jgi:hypothetical protein